MRELRFLLVVLGLLGIWWGGRQWQMRRQEQRRLQGRQDRLLPDLNRQAIAALELELGGERVRLKRSGTAWQVEERNFPANPVYVDLLLDGLVGAPAGVVVSGDVAQHDRYGLAGRASVVRLFDESDKELTRLYVGKFDTGYRASYVRCQGDPAVRRVPVEFAVFLHRPTWYDRTVWRLSAEALRGISWREGAWQAQVLREGTDLLQPSSGRVWPVADRAVQSLLHLRASEVRFDLALPAEATLGLLLEGPAMELHILRRPDHYLATRDGRVFYVLAREMLDEWATALGPPEP